LARSNPNVRSDGSRIEGWHKGWNSLQRTFTSGEKFGLVTSEYATSFKGLLEIKEEIKEEDALDLLDHADTERPVSVNADPTLPTQPDPQTSGGNIAPVAIQDPSNMRSMIVMSPSASPAPVTSPTQHRDNSAAEPITNAQQLEPLLGVKRKAASDDDVEGVKSAGGMLQAKKSRTEISEVTAVNVSRDALSLVSLCSAVSGQSELSATAPNTLQAYFRDRKASGTVNTAGKSDPSHSARTSTQAGGSKSADVFQLPVPLNLQGLTKSQRLFSVATQIDVRSLTVSGDVEFYLFMDMRAERGWASFKMTPYKWVAETVSYNARLEELNKKADKPFIPKNPRALVDKLAAIKIKITDRLATQNFKCEVHLQIWRHKCLPSIRV
jgi:hypothetical protein